MLLGQCQVDRPVTREADQRHHMAVVKPLEVTVAQCLATVWYQIRAMAHTTSDEIIAVEKQAASIHLWN